MTSRVARLLSVVALPALGGCSAGPAGGFQAEEGGRLDQADAGTTSGGGSSGRTSDGGATGAWDGSGGTVVTDGSAGTVLPDGWGGATSPDGSSTARDGATAMAVGDARADGNTTSPGGGDGGTDGNTSSAGDGAVGDSRPPSTPVTVYIAGDSTVSTYTLDPNNPKSWAGWGQMLAPHYSASVTVVNDAIGGRTARRFIQEGHLASILNIIQTGDYLLVQFGTNDSNPTATYTLGGVTYPYYAAAATDFKTYLQQYIDGAHSKGATPVLVTPPPRNSAYCNGGNSLGSYDQAMIDLGKADNVAVVDLGLMAFDYVKAICPKPTTGAQETFFKVNPDGTIDGTHFQENGARTLAGFVADGITQDALGLAAYRIN
jgi:lysophospholipase L1-like esterase